jgi:hypothetical protein
LGQVHDDQGEDHEWKRSDLEHLGGHRRPPPLKMNSHDLQKSEEVRSQGGFDRVPASKDDDGQGDPPGSFGALRPAPAGLGAQRESSPCKAYQEPARHRVPELDRSSVCASGIGRFRVLPDGPKAKTHGCFVQVPPDKRNQEQAQVRGKALIK